MGRCQELEGILVAGTTADGLAIQRFAPVLIEWCHGDRKSVDPPRVFYAMATAGGATTRDLQVGLSSEFSLPECHVGLQLERTDQKAGRASVRIFS